VTNPDTQPEALAQALATTDVLQRVAGTVAIHLYELELNPDGSYECHSWIGAGLERLLGPVPPHLSPEEAWELAIHPEDREPYDAAYEAVQRGEPIELEYRLVGFDGVTRWAWDRMRPRRTEDGRLFVDGIVADVTERREITEELAEANRKLAHIAYHDPLTDLPNRISFEERLEAALSDCGSQGSAVAVLFVDLDNFKLINDSFGHAAGDELLCAVAERLRRATRPGDVVARHGGDEFLILAALDPRRDDEGGHHLAAEPLATRVRQVLRTPFVLCGVEIYVSASVGISLFPYDAEDAATLLKHADVAMYSAKQSGRDGHRLYDVDGDDPLAQLSMAGRLREAVEGGSGLVLHYQPLVRLAGGEVVGVEALIRWQDGDQLLPPASFLPLAERIGLLGLMSEWVLEEACCQASSWRREGLDLVVSINVPPSFWQPTAMRHVLATINAFGLESDHLMIELTESALMADTRPGMDPLLAEFHRRGLRLAIDDFGTGHSSLGRLHQMCVSALKIDRSFVHDLENDSSAEVIVTSIIQLARNLGLEPVAEGIETAAQRDFLVERGCEFGQGFYFSPPVAADEIPALARGMKRVEPARAQRAVA